VIASKGAIDELLYAVSVITAPAERYSPCAVLVWNR
jgi:hypothetical protein